MYTGSPRARCSSTSRIRSAQTSGRSTVSIASPTRCCISATENPSRIFIPSSAALRTRSALTPRRTNSTCQNADLTSPTREISPRLRNDGASARTDERLISVRSRSKKAALGDKRQRAGESAGAARVDRRCDLCDLGRDERWAAVCRLPKPRVERDAPEERHAELGREPLPATGAEHLRRHVLDDPDDAHPGLLRHGRRA